MTRTKFLTYEVLAAMEAAEPGITIHVGDAIRQYQGTKQAQACDVDEFLAGIPQADPEDWGADENTPVVEAIRDQREFVEVDSQPEWASEMVSLEYRP